MPEIIYIRGLEAEAISTDYRGTSLLETIEVLVPGIGNACASFFLKSIEADKQAAQ